MVGLWGLTVSSLRLPQALVELSIRLIFNYNLRIKIIVHTKCNYFFRNYQILLRQEPQLLQNSKRRGEKTDIFVVVEQEEGETW